MKPETFCDNCADVLNLKDAVIFGSCPFPTASTHAGESATLCKTCAHTPAPNLSPMENPNTPTPSGTSPGAASAGSGQTAARRFLVQFKMTACEEYSAPTPAAALSDAENDDAPPLGDFTGDEGPEIVAEWDPIAELWGDVRPVRPWNGIDENTRDPLELDDDAPPVPSELDDDAETEGGSK